MSDYPIKQCDYCEHTGTMPTFMDGETFCSACMKKSSDMTRGRYLKLMDQVERQKIEIVSLRRERDTWEARACREATRNHDQGESLSQCRVLLESARELLAETVESENAFETDWDKAAKHWLSEHEPLTETLPPAVGPALQQRGPSTYVGVCMDEIDASKEALDWIKQLIDERGYRAEPSAEIRHEEFSPGCGGITSLWVNNRPVATVVLQRDAFNHTTFCATEHHWSGQEG